MTFDTFKSAAADTNLSVTPQGASIGGVEAAAIPSSESPIASTSPGAPTSASPTLEATTTSIITITTSIASATTASQRTTSSSNAITASFVRVTLASTLLAALWSVFHFI